jgi:hypothetical protein
VADIRASGVVPFGHAFSFGQPFGQAYSTSSQACSMVCLFVKAEPGGLDIQSWRSRSAMNSTETAVKRPQLLLRLLPSEIESIREAASAANKTMSDYVGDLHRRRVSRIPGDSAEIDALYRVTRQIVWALGTQTPAVDKLIADLGRMSGRLKDLFETDYGKALAHQDAINETLLDVRSMRAAIDAALGEIRLELAEPRDQLVEILGVIDKRRRKRDAGA